MANEGAASPYPSAGAIAEVARESQQIQLESIDWLDTKAAGVLAFAGVVLTLLFTSDPARTHWNGLLTAAAAALGSATLPLLAALLPRGYHHNPNIVALAPAYMDKGAEETQRVIALSIARSFALNQNLVRWKVRAMRLGMALVAAGIALTSAGLIYSVVVPKQ